MPVSDYHAVSDIMGEIQRISPKSVLDLGCGFGKWGVLCREILDARFGRCHPDQWQAIINGYEAFAGYENPCWRIYNTGFFVEDFRSRIFQEYDLVLMIDSLEHMPMDEGRPFLRGLVQRNKHVIISVPNGRMDQGETYGNPHEAHLWTFNGTKEFEPYYFKVIHQSVCTVVSIEGCKT